MRVTLTSTGLSPEEVSKRLEDGRFENHVTLEPIEEGAPAGSPQAAEIPLSERPGPSGYLLMENGSPAHPTLALSLFTCRTATCEAAHEAAEDSLGENRRITLPTGMSVKDVRYGDNNGDGLTDVLVVLSTGAGILYQQASGMRAATPPPPRPAGRPPHPIRTFHL